MSFIIGIHEFRMHRSTKKLSRRWEYLCVVCAQHIVMEETYAGQICRTVNILNGALSFLVIKKDPDFFVTISIPQYLFTQITRKGPSSVANKKNLF